MHVWVDSVAHSLVDFILLSQQELWLSSKVSFFLIFLIVMLRFRRGYDMLLNLGFDFRVKCNFILIFRVYVMVQDIEFRM